MIAPRGPLAGAGGGPRYRLRPSVEPFVDRHGALCLVRPGDQDLVVRRPDRADVALVMELRHDWVSAGVLAERLGLDRPLVESKLASLVGADLALVADSPRRDALGAEERERFSRQLPYLAELGDDVRLQQRLRDATVTVIGCGGLGTWAVAGLACVGVGHIVLVDDDEVALSNLNRQILYARDDVGLPKVAAAARWLAGFDPAIEVTALERRIEALADAERVIAGADAVVLAADTPPYEIGRWINAGCVHARVPFIVAGQLPPLLKIGPTYMPGVGPCFACHETMLRQASQAYDDYVAFRVSEPITAPTLGPASCVAGGLMALELLHLLTGQMPATSSAALLVHIRTLAVRQEPVPRDPACSVCKHLE